MQQIDFLPQEYRHRYRTRQNQLRTVALAGVVAVGLFAIELVQQYRYWQLGKAVADCRPAYNSAIQLQEELTTLQQELRTAENEAQLFAYLQHPWPRTQIISALLLSLPAEIALDELEIHRRATSGRKVLASLVTSEKEEENPSPDTAGAADLKQLHQRYDARQTVVLITGKTTDLAALHYYLAQLGEQDLFTKAELQSVESQDRLGTITRFRAQLTVRPGYGQKGGPVEPLFFVKYHPVLHGGRLLVAGSTNFPDGTNLQVCAYRLLDTAEQAGSANWPPGRKLLGRQTVVVQQGRFEANLLLVEPVAVPGCGDGTTGQAPRVEQAAAAAASSEPPQGEQGENAPNKNNLTTTQLVACVSFSPHDQQPNAVLEQTGSHGERLRGHGVRKKPSVTVFEAWQPVSPPGTPNRGNALAANHR